VGYDGSEMEARRVAAKLAEGLFGRVGGGFVHGAHGKFEEAKHPREHGKFKAKPGTVHGRGGASAPGMMPAGDFPKPGTRAARKRAEALHPSPENVDKSKRRAARDAVRAARDVMKHGAFQHTPQHQADQHRELDDAEHHARRGSHEHAIRKAERSLSAEAARHGSHGNPGGNHAKRRKAIKNAREAIDRYHAA
jgi:hypothetical protein